MRPGSATVVELHGDDRMTVIDPDGGQPAEITVLAPDGREDPGAIGATADAAGEGACAGSWPRAATTASSARCTPAG